MKVRVVLTNGISFLAPVIMSPVIYQVRQRSAGGLGREKQVKHNDYLTIFAGVQQGAAPLPVYGLPAVPDVHFEPGNALFKLILREEMEG